MSRKVDIDAFLQGANWGAAHRIAVPGDASTRRYERLTLGKDKSVLMDAPKGVEAPSEPEGASVKDRVSLGYNALARLAGPNPEAFTCIANELSKRGFSSPKIIAADMDKGFILLEDLGDGLYAEIIAKDGAMEQLLYEAAIDTLAAIYRSTFPSQMNFQDIAWRVREYDAAALQAEADLFLDWYAKDFGYDIQGHLRDEWHRIWSDLFECLSSHAPGLALRDFHAENIFWLPERQAVSRVGLIDFQDALFAHPSYDLVSLIEDARRDVSPDLAEPLIERFCEKAGIKYDDSFKTAYAAMGAQRNAKILGIFVRLAQRDGKPHYRDLIPRVAAHFQGNLEDLKCAELKSWISTHLPKALT
ncbi:aminoglycoside phosphotransferase family protein [Hellea balneolensis]|uniref:aminoglycoside phosphotransferase family protein n=1 Tax=Hellea balneolensis TaxID=287478 RepID=UPI000405AF59|nr:phosphotransferase [Hellea balneolensis]